jgi:hypothetical protein
MNYLANRSFRSAHLAGVGVSTFPATTDWIKPGWREGFAGLGACATLAVVMALASQAAKAQQTIERVKLTDNDLSCQQMYAEAQQMDTTMALAGPGLPVVSAAPAATATPVAVVPGGALTLAQMHAPTAALATQQGLSAQYQQQIANNMAAAQQNGRNSAAPSPAQPSGLAGALGTGMLGSLLARTGAAAAAPATVPAPVQAAGAGLGAQARARKDHLTGLFLSRGCKLSEMQK